MWLDYLRYFRFASPEEETRGRIVWEYIAAENFPKYLFAWKRSALNDYESIENARNHKPAWTSLKVWQELCDYWLGPTFQKASELRKRNRSSSKMIPHTIGMITFEETDLILAEELGRPPTQIERFTNTHLKKKKSNDNNENIWLTEDAKRLEKSYADDLRKANGFDSETPVNAVLNPGCVAVVDHGYKIWEEAVGGVKKGKLFGRPRERRSKRSGKASLLAQASYLACQNNSEESKKKDKKMAKMEAYITNMAPLWAQIAEKCGFAPEMFMAPDFNDTSSSTPISDGASNIPATPSPMDDDEGDDASLMDDDGEPGDEFP